MPESAVHTRAALHQFKDKHPGLVFPSTAEGKLFVLTPWLAYRGQNPFESDAFIPSLAEATHQDGRQLILDIGPGLTRTPLEAAQRFPNATIIAMDYEEAPMDVPMGQTLPVQQGTLIVSIQARFQAVENLNADRIHWMAPEEAGSYLSAEHLDKLLRPGGELVLVFIRKSDIDHILIFEEIFGLKYLLRQEDLSYQEIHNRFGFSHTNWSRRRDGIVTVVYGTKP